MSGMKVYLTDEKELIMEPSIKWAGNPNVTVAVKAFGLKATVQVVDLQVFASFPWFADIYVSLMDKFIRETVEAEKERKKEKRRSISWLIIELQQEYKKHDYGTGNTC
nr:synaptotagmin-1 [Quercus suber]